MSDCPRCQARTWRQPVPPRCSFPSGTFDPEGWNCATMSELRDIAGRRGPTSSEDQHAATLPWDGDFLVLGWYKNRGRTEFAGILRESAMEPLTLASADEFIAWDAECRAQEAEAPRPHAGDRLIATVELTPHDRVYIAHSERLNLDITDTPVVAALREERDRLSGEVERWRDLAFRACESPPEGCGCPGCMEAMKAANAAREPGT